MAVDVAAQLIEFFLQYGLPALLLGLALDSAMLLPVVPGELMLVLAAERYATDRFTLGFVLVATAAASTLGNLFVYGVARGGGRRLVENHPRLFFMSPSTRDRLERTFQKPIGQSLVLLLRLLPMLRILVSIPAGLARMPWIRYTVLTFLGNLAFNGAVLWIAYETRRPNSFVAAQMRWLRSSFAEPVWAFVQTHWFWTAVMVVALGLFLSLRASAKSARRTDRPFEGSLLGTATTTGLLWTGILGLVGLWTDPDIIFGLMRTTGYDVQRMAGELPFGPYLVVALIASILIIIALLVSAVRSQAREHHRRLHAKHKRTAPPPRPEPKPSVAAPPPGLRARLPEREGGSGRP